MDVDVRPVSRLRESPAAQATLGPIVTALCSSTADLSRVRVACDWIQYRNNFREPVTCRPLLAAGGLAATGQPGPAEQALEIAIDLRRCADADVGAWAITPRTYWSGPGRRSHTTTATSARSSWRRPGRLSRSGSWPARRSSSTCRTSTTTYRPTKWPACRAGCTGSRCAPTCAATTRTRSPSSSARPGKAWAGWSTGCSASGPSC